MITNLLFTTLCLFLALLVNVGFNVRRRVVRVRERQHPSRRG